MWEREYEHDREGKRGWEGGRKMVEEPSISDSALTAEEQLHCTKTLTQSQCVCVCVSLRGEATHHSTGSDGVIKCCSTVILTLLSELGIIVSVIQEPNLDPEARTVMGLLTPVSLPQPGDRTQGTL